MRVALLGVIALGVACGGEVGARRIAPVGPRAPVIPPSTASSTSTTTTSLPVPAGLDREVVSSVWEDYLHMRTVMAGARRQGDPTSPLLDSVLTNAMLEHQRGVLAAGTDDGDFLGSFRARLMGVRDLGPRLIELDVCLEEGGEVQRRTESMIAEGGVWKYAGRNSRTARPGECPGV